MIAMNLEKISYFMYLYLSISKLLARLCELEEERDDVTVTKRCFLIPRGHDGGNVIIW